MKILALVTVMIWFFQDGQVKNVHEWGEVPVIGVEYITVCGETGAHGKPLRRRFSSADFYCNTSRHTPDGWEQSRWIEGEQEPLHVFLARSGCDPSTVKFGLMIAGEIWSAIEKEADRWECD